MYTVIKNEGPLIALQLTGKLQKEDYAKLTPLLEEKIRQYGKINLYWEMDDFEGWQPQGLLDDLDFDAKHANDFNKIAMVGEKTWEQWMTTLMKPFTSAEIQYFDRAQRVQALAWVASKAATA